MPTLDNCLLLRVSEQTLRALCSCFGVPERSNVRPVRDWTRPFKDVEEVIGRDPSFRGRVLPGALGVRASFLALAPRGSFLTLAPGVSWGLSTLGGDVFTELGDDDDDLMWDIMDSRSSLHVA